MWKHKALTAAAVWALVLLTALFTACSDTDASSESSSSTSSASSASEEDSSSEEIDHSDDLVGRVTGIDGDTLEIYVFDVYPTAQDYTDLSEVTLTALGTTQYATLDSDAAFEKVVSGSLEIIEQEELAEQDMVAITTQDGVQTVIVLDYDPDDAQAEEEDSSSDSGLSDEDASAVAEAAGE